MKKIIFLLILLFPIIVFANTSYDIESYQIDVKINKNHTYNYQENIGVNFLKNDKYIIRKMNDENYNFKVDKNYTLETNKNSIAKIYSRNTNDTYKISYEFKKEEKKSNYYEVFIENNYDKKINNISFSLNLPMSVTSKNISIYIGKKNITELVDYNVTGNIVNGTYNKTLNPNEKITIKINYGKFYMNASTMICIIIPITLTIFSYLLWRFFGKDLPSRIEKTSKFPKNITPIHLALTDHPEITNEDNYYMLLKLASEGYLTIIQEKDEFYIKREKEYKGTNYIEALFFKTIFRAGESISFSEYINILSEKKDNKNKIYQADRVETKYLKKKYNIASDTIKQYLEEQHEKDKYYEEKPERIKNILIAMIALILILITSLPFLEINLLPLLPLSVVLSTFILYFLIKFIKNINLDSKKDKDKIILSVLLTLLVIILIPSFRRNIGFSIAFLVSFMSSLIILIIYKYMPKRTIYAQNIYNKREGFVKLINNITKKELDNIMELNPNYLIEILPIAYQLGVSDKVIELLKKNNISKPNWFIVPEKFSYPKLNKAILDLKEKLTSSETK